jgi:transposase
MRTLSLDLRERILASYDNEEGSRQDIADRYRVSLGMVKKLLQQRKRTGEIGPRHHCSGRKPMIVAAHHRQLQALFADPQIAQQLEAIGRKNDETINKNEAAAVAARLGTLARPVFHWRLDQTTSSRVGTRQKEASRG